MTKTFAIADIHGRYDLMDAALAKIEASADGGTVVFLGDYVDRGPDSRRVIKRLMDGPPSGWAWVCLKGNHEDMMVSAIGGPDDTLQWWLGNGGSATLASYPRHTIPKHHLDWCSARAQYHKDNHRIYVHALADPTKPMSEQSEAVLLWMRCGKHQNIEHPEGYVVHGHTPFDDGPIILSGRANLDTGAVYTGRLCVAVFDDETPGGPIDTWSVKE